MLSPGLMPHPVPVSALPSDRAALRHMFKGGRAGHLDTAEGGGTRPVGGPNSRPQTLHVLWPVNQAGARRPWHTLLGQNVGPALGPLQLPTLGSHMGVPLGGRPPQASGH